MKLRIVHLYSKEMNIYGDRGNVITLAQRLVWRGYEAEVIEVGIGQEFDWSKADIVFAGGGQDRGQIAVGNDLQRHGDALHKLADAGVPMLTICGTYQLFGREFVTMEGERIPGIGIFKARTVGSAKRMIGNIVVDAGELGQLVGFENHSGETFLDEGQAPLGKVGKGFGNNNNSGFEGAVSGNVYGTYCHGPALPKNPQWADAMLAAALRPRGIDELARLDDQIARQAADVAAKRPQ
jgi:lipid II isoglutaminyl synthase (glutamine-hydrolysing)